jgi:hypothetical protein
VRLAPELIDVDTAADAHEVAQAAPDSRFAATLLGLPGVSLSGVSLSEVSPSEVSPSEVLAGL